MLPRSALLLLLAPPGPADDLAAPLPITSRDHAPRVLGADAPPPLAAQPGLLFVNFDGGQMQDCGWGNDDPHANCSTIFDGLVLPYTGDAHARAAVVQVVRSDLRDFAVAVTDRRPPGDVDYDMEMVGDWDPAPGGNFAGVAPSIDCFDQSGGETSFTLEYTGTATGIAKAVLQEVAHTWGLEHVDAGADLLYPTTAGALDPTFVDACFQIVELDGQAQPVPTAGQCASQHAQHCGSGDLQNSRRELLQLFGPRAPDLVAPTVAITAPLDGAELGASFALALVAADEKSPQLLHLRIAGEGAATFTTEVEYASPVDLAFPLKGLPGGAYTVTVTATDEEGNQSQDAVAFTVLGADDGATGDPSGSTTDVPSPTTGDLEATDPTSDPGDPPADAGDDGCGCRGAPPSGLALLAALARRRRRR
jgi:hypothetical protein